MVIGRLIKKEIIELLEEKPIKDNADWKEVEK